MRRPLPIIAVVIVCCAAAEDNAARAQQIPRPVAQACAGGKPTDVLHVYSECNADGLWHVVTDRVFRCADGSSESVRISDRPTKQRYDDQPTDPDAPPRTLHATSGMFPQVRSGERASEIGKVTLRRCENGYWVNVVYEVYLAEDGRVLIDWQRGVPYPTQERCTEDETGQANARNPGMSRTAPSISTPIFTLEPIDPSRARQSALALGPLVNMVAYASALNAVRMDSAMLSAEQKITASEPSEDILSELDDGLVIEDRRVNPPGRGFGAAIGALIDLIQGPRLRAAQPAPPIEILFTSLGGSTGEILEMQVFKTGTGPVRLQGLDVVLEPLKQDASTAIRRELQKRSVAAARTIRFNGYCLEFLKAPPPAGTVFRIAPAAIQQQFAPVRNVLDSARRLHKAGQLNPDSDPKAYYHAITNWAIWAQKEQFTLDSFGKAFIEHTKRNVQAAGRPWSKELEGLIEKTVPNRWNDVSQVLRDAQGVAAGRRDAR
jgi:hypothetical protein